MSVVMRMVMRFMPFMMMVMLIMGGILLRVGVMVVFHRVAMLTA